MRVLIVDDGHGINKEDLRKVLEDKMYHLEVEMAKDELREMRFEIRPYIYPREVVALPHNDRSRLHRKHNHDKWKCGKRNPKRYQY